MLRPIYPQHSHKLTQSGTHLCDLSVMAPLGRSWQMTALFGCQPPCLSQWGVCEREKNLQDPAELWIFIRKDGLLRPCCSADYEKQVIFFLSKYKPNICAGKNLLFGHLWIFPWAKNRNNTGVWWKNMRRDWSEAERWLNITNWATVAVYLVEISERCYKSP